MGVYYILIFSLYVFILDKLQCIQRSIEERIRKDRIEK